MRKRTVMITVRGRGGVRARSRRAARAAAHVPLGLPRPPTG